jgi:hypothetical protein
MSDIDIATLTRDEKSLLLYVETCCVDYGGLLEGIRMNESDHKALDRFKAEGVLDFGRIPSELLGQFSRKVTKWCDLTDTGWALAHQLRRARAASPSWARQQVDEIRAAKAELVTP